MARLEPTVFKIPTDKLRYGYYTDRYFLRTQEVLWRDRRTVTVGYQFFPRADGVICGLDEALAILKTCAGSYRDKSRAGRLYRRLRRAQWKFQHASFRQNQRAILAWGRERSRLRMALNRLWVGGWKRLEVRALRDGDRVRANEPVLAITGDPRLFAHLETALLGVIARPTATATAVARVVRAARGKHVLFFSARFDHYWVQATDGYAALKGGAFAVSTDANADYWGTESMGTIPHFLIGCYGGDSTQAFLAFDRHIDARVNRIALVDWDNDCIGTTRRILEALVMQAQKSERLPERIFLEHARAAVGGGRGRLWGVRLDTSGSLRDRSVRAKAARGVCAELVRRARREFDRWGCRALKIVVSGGFDEEKIAHFEKMKVPADVYGVGSSLLRHRIDITADIVEYEGRPCAKVGRKKGDWSRLRRVL
jgi:nicotinate phosphoribosyltransferase